MQMKFTLGLSDYMDQYTINESKEDPHCPVCYEQLLTFDLKSDVMHVITCYKESVLLDTIHEYHNKTGEYPALTGEFIDQVLSRVATELADYCVSHQISQHLL